MRRQKLAEEQAELAKQPTMNKHSQRLLAKQSNRQNKTMAERTAEQVRLREWQSCMNGGCQC